MSESLTRFRAYLGENEAGQVRVCAWCRDAAQLTAAVEAAGRVCTHGMCRTHLAAMRTRTAAKLKGVPQTWTAA